METETRAKQTDRGSNCETDTSVRTVKRLLVGQILAACAETITPSACQPMVKRLWEVRSPTPTYDRKVQTHRHRYQSLLQRNKLTAGGSSGQSRPKRGERTETIERHRRRALSLRRRTFRVRGGASNESFSVERRAGDRGSALTAHLRHWGNLAPKTMTDVERGTAQQPLVQCDVQRHFVLKDVIHALKTLSSHVDVVIGSVTRRIETQKKRLDMVNKRMTICEKTIKTIQGSNQAITVFSMPKYPPSTFIDKSFLTYYILSQTDVPEQDVNSTANSESNLSYKIQDLNSNCSSINASGGTIVGTNEFDGLITVDELYPKLHAHNNGQHREAIIMEDEGLGPPPRLNSTLTDILLFNSEIVPYSRKSFFWDKIPGENEIEQEDEISEADCSIAVAPTTLIDGDILPNVVGLDMSYKPAEAEALDLNLPSNLPLPDLADIAFFSRTTTIAPSATLLPDIGPSLNQGGLPTYLKGTEKSQTYEEDIIQQYSTGTPPRHVENVKPPPPPPPLQWSSAASRLEMDTASTGKPINKIDEKKESQKEDKSINSSFVPPPKNTFAINPARSSLLDAIKNSNMDMLRSAEERKVTEKRTGNNADSSQGGSLMDALRERMKRRHSTISGKRDRLEQKWEANSLREARLDGTITRNDGVQPSLPAKIGECPLPSSSFGNTDEDDPDSDLSSDHSAISAITELGVERSPRVSPMSSVKVKTEASLQPSKVRPKLVSSQNQDPRHGSLFDADNTTLNRLLNVADRSSGEDCDSDVWDDSD